MALLTWMEIAACLSQSDMLSGLNLAFFAVSKLELKIKVAKNNAPAGEIRDQFAELPR